MPGRRYVNIDDPDSGDRVATVHIYAADDPEVERRLAFRDFLRETPEQAREYSAVKLTCAVQHPTDIVGYMDCKDQLCKRIEADAIVWAQSRQ